MCYYINKYHHKFTFDYLGNLNTIITVVWKRNKSTQISVDCGQFIIYDNLKELYLLVITQYDIFVKLVGNNNSESM